MKIEVVIPSVGDPSRLLWSLTQQSRPPDQITVVSNEFYPEFCSPPTAFTGYESRIRALRFGSEDYPFGYCDVVLRRNIGIWESDADAIIFQDDDQIAPRNLVQEMERILLTENWAWGHHRYIDFEDHDPVELLDADPSIGKSRETEPNRFHTYQSGYAGCLGVKRDFILSKGGFDMLFLGRHANEDQNLAKRMCGPMIKIWEPPFSWHPTRPVPRAQGPTNVCTGEHDWEPDVFNGVVFSRCSRCPLWKFSDRKEQLFRDEVVVPYEHRLVDVTVEAI
jgi:hypothetical protein